MTLPNLGAGLLMAGGLVNAIPPLSERLSKTFGGKPVVQIVVGVVSVIVGFALITQMK